MKRIYLRGVRLGSLLLLLLSLLEGEVVAEFILPRLLRWRRGLLSSSLEKRSTNERFGSTLPLLFSTIKGPAVEREEEVEVEVVVVRVE